MIIGTMLAACMLAGTPSTMDLDFPGGTAAAWTAAIRSASPGVNIVLNENAASAAISAMTLKEVTVESVMQLSKPASGGMVESDEIIGDGETIWVVEAAIASARQQPRRSGNRATTTPRQTDAVSVHVLPPSYTSGDGPARLVAMLKAVNDLKYDQPLVVLLAGGQIVAIRGTYDQLDIAQSVIEALASVQPSTTVARASADRSSAASAHAKLDPVCQTTAGPRELSRRDAHAAGG
jgi:hypothetical protein